MSRPPTRRPTDARSAAEAMFKPKPKPAPEPVRPAAPPAARELVSLRLDREVLDHFQKDGPGWQERVNAALRDLVRRG